VAADLADQAAVSSERLTCHPIGQFLVNTGLNFQHQTMELRQCVSLTIRQVGRSPPTSQEGFLMLNFFAWAVNALTAPLQRDDRGATAVEYGLIVALIAAVIIVIVGVLGKQVSDAFSTVVNGM